MGKREEPLTFKQEKFCKYYVDTEGNASEAYRMSYNTCLLYTSDAADD